MRSCVVYRAIALNQGTQPLIRSAASRPEKCFAFYLFLAHFNDENKLPFALLVSQANFLFAQTNGFTLAVDIEISQVVLQEKVVLEGLYFPAFFSLFEKFIETASDWKDQLASFGKPLQS